MHISCYYIKINTILYEHSQTEIKRIWKGNTFVLSTGSHKFQGLDEVMIAPKGAQSLSPTKIKLCGEMPHFTKGNLIDYIEHTLIMYPIVQI